MGWQTVSLFKGYGIFNVRPNTWFNVESMTGVKFQSLNMQYSYITLRPYGTEWDASLSLSGTYPNYIINCSGSVNPSTSMLNVIALEN